MAPFISECDRLAESADSKSNYYKNNYHIGVHGNSEDNNNKAKQTKQAESDHHDYKTTMTHHSRGRLLLKLPHSL